MIVEDVEAAADEVLRRLGNEIVLGLPLGLGKPVPFVNALYERARKNPAIHLKILTALTLEKPSGDDPLKQAFLEPIVERVYRDCPDPAYAAALRKDALPDNIEVCEFFFRPGSLLESAHAQRHYISSNYTHAARDVAAQGCNVVSQMVAKRSEGGLVRYSLSCNPDVTPELVERLRRLGRDFLTVGMVNDQLPFMYGDADVASDFFDIVVDHSRYAHTLFSTPKMAVLTADFVIGLHASALIRDGGTVQIGIGELGDAAVHAMMLRHRDSAAYREILRASGILPEHEELVQGIGGTGRFGEGLHGASEMLVDGFMDLFKAGILKRRVFDHWALQRTINERLCDPDDLSPDVLDRLASLGVGSLGPEAFATLQRHGFFEDGVQYDDGHLVAPEGERVIADLSDPRARRLIGERYLGRSLRNGALASATFFLGTAAFYEWLRALDEGTRAAFRLLRVEKTNQLDRDPRLYQEQRVHARFLNSAMKVTLAGDIVSDGLEDARVVSGVGGQYNFVAMAHQLPTARAIIMLRATREEHGRVTSNIVAGYGHCTIPRHLRDIVVTEYGVADLRSRTDSGIAKSLLNLADSRFQAKLLADAVRAGKVEPGYRIPEAHRANTPERLERNLAPYAALFPRFPLGTDLTPLEQTLAIALRRLKGRIERGRARALLDALQAGAPPAEASPYLERMHLTSPKDLRTRIARRLLVLELKSIGVLDGPSGNIGSQ